MSKGNVDSMPPVLKANASAYILKTVVYRGLLSELWLYFSAMP